MNIMITGASGEYGSYAIDYLKKFVPGANLYGLVRNETKGQVLKEKGVNVRIGDFTDANSMIDALKGIDRLLFVSVSIPNIQQNVVQAAQINHVKYIAYTSIYQPEYAKFGLESIHKQTEKWIEDSGIPYTFLRNSWYMEVNQALFDYAEKTKKFPYFSKEGELSFALKREYAEAGARVILDGNYGHIVNLAGKPKTYGQIVLATQEALDTDLDIKQVSSSEFVPELMSAGISSQGTLVSEGYQEYTLKGNNGENLADSAEFEKVLGHPLTKLPVAIKELLFK
ncbi:NAD(P)H-binding protein [Companilactobacillus musae]|uniref:NAD(P)H-binding protein n=1 Tax=Companilactobacillus musae TaxID=1903258 RepID=UPI000E64F4C2|nr:NAD(P)H-binding protein [Companilactobacillus musae]